MTDTALFRTRDGAWITSASLVQLLEKVGAGDSEVVYMHTGLTFGWPNPELGRRRLLELVYEAIVSIGVRTLCVPTFTFSFCNGQNYDVQSSNSKMGALNEYIRRLPGAVRSVDPLMSSAAVGADAGVVQNLSKNSIGADSTFDRLHQRGSAVKFLFFGTTASECFTYTHYVEERKQVGYRYNRTFTGKITQDSRTWEDQYTLFVRYAGVVPASDQKLERALLASGAMRKELCGDSSISCVSEPAAYATIVEHLDENPLCYIASMPAVKNCDFVVHEMVAL